MNDSNQEKRFNDALDKADAVLGEIVGLGLEGNAREAEPEVSEELVLRLWGHASWTVTALGALHNDTPRTIADDLYARLPEDDEHRAKIEKSVEELRRKLDEQG